MNDTSTHIRGSAAWIRTQIIEVIESVPAANTPRKRLATAKRLQGLATATLDRWVIEHSVVALVTSEACPPTGTHHAFDRSHDLEARWDPVRSQVLTEMASAARLQALGHEKNWSPLVDALSRFPPMRLAVALDACASALEVDLKIESWRFDRWGNIWTEVASFERGICVLAIRRLLSVCAHVFGEDTSGRPLPTIGSVFRAPAADEGEASEDAEMNHFASYGLADKLDVVLRIHEVRGLTQRAARQASRELTWFEWLRGGPEREARRRLQEHSREQLLLLDQLATELQQALLTARRAREPWLDIAEAIVDYANRLNTAATGRFKVSQLRQARADILAALQAFPRPAPALFRAHELFRTASANLTLLHGASGEPAELHGQREAHQALANFAVECRAAFGGLPLWGETFTRFVWWYATSHGEEAR